MGETCFHVPARVFGFESTVELSGQPERSPGQLEQRASLLSALLKGSRQPLPSTYMDTSDADSEDGDEDMEAAEAEENDEAEELVSAAGGTAPVPIPSTSESREAFLKAQREAYQRFVYAHQIEEMRKQCAAYFARQARFNEVMASNSSVSHNQHESIVPTEQNGQRLAVPQLAARHRKPGF